MSPVCPGVKEDEPETALGYFENDAPHARYRWFRQCYRDPVCRRREDAARDSGSFGHRSPRAYCGGADGDSPVARIAST
jgi:hypothetical protein